MIVVTSSQIAGKKITRTLGLARGTTVRAHHVGNDILAFIRNMIGGEVIEYTKMLAEAREQALDRMTQEAKGLGANAVVDVRFSTSDIATGAAEVLVYGTAVWIEDAS
ncbi:MAG: YbjQ family protein [Candidatus Hydrogenedentes bacterium]|nr:YbjQ family protein [Candidatus Hydrogenedentota bacterium]